MPNREGLRTWVEIDRRAIAKNYRAFRGRMPRNIKLMAVVKSNAYGHGLVEFSREAQRLGADWLAVDSAVEGLALRKVGIRIPILVSGYTHPALVKSAAAARLSLTAASFEKLKALARSRAKVNAHIKADTGMHRQGFLPDERAKVLRFLKRHSSVRPEGLYTHLASAKNPALPGYAEAQLAEFDEWCAAFHEAGYRPLRHAAATAGALAYPQSHCDMARVGIGLYGLWPSPEVEAEAGGSLELRPALSWKTIVAGVKKLPKGARIGYDGTEELVRPSLVAVCPVGYWHGYPRALSGAGHVLVRGRRCKVLGRVSMDMITIDLTDAPGAKAGDEVTLIGASRAASVSAEELANLAGTVNYEIVTRINPLIKRFYV